MDRLYQVSALGRKASGGITSSSRDSVLDYIRNHRVVSVDELTAVTGLPRTEVSNKVRTFQRRGLVVELTGGSNV